MSSSPLPINDLINTSTLLNPYPPDLAYLDFDGVQRYSLLARLLDRLLCRAPRPVTILEVGSNVLNLLGEFLHPTQIKVTRCDVDRFGNDPDFVLIERNKPLPFADQSFDAVASLEVLEHMPAETRPAFLAECLRVARYGAVFSCPNGRAEVAESERLAAESYCYRNGLPNPFLAEHEEFGLPREEEILAILRGLGYPHASFDNSPLSVWLPLIVFTQTLSERSPLAFHLQRRINQAFFPGLADGSQLCYRKFYVCAKHPDAAAALQPLPETASLLAKKHEQPPPLQALQILARVVAGAMTAAEEEAQQLASCRSELLSFREQQTVLASSLTEMVESSSWKQTRWLRKVQSVLWPRRYGRDDLIPFHQLEKIQAGKWVATGKASRFLLPTALPAGWLRLRMKMISDRASHVDFYVDRGNGLQLVDRFPPEQLLAGLHVDRYYKFTAPVRVIRIDPLDTTGTLQIDEFQVDEVPLLRLMVRAIGHKLRRLRAEGRLASALFKSLLLLLTGKLSEFKSRLRQQLPQPSYEVKTPEPPPAAPPLTDIPDGYPEWCRRHERTDADRERLRNQCRLWKQPPRISVLMAVCDSSADHLQRAIESVQRQLYPCWELCIAYDSSGPAAIRSITQEYAEQDSRIKVVDDGTGRTATALNATLELATGEYVALLDQWDELAEHALFNVAQTILADRDTDYLYSDEDRIEADGRRVGPFFKPDWSPEYLLAGMYTGNLSVYRTSLVREVGGFRKDYEPAHDYDLALRITAQTSRTGHLPDVLYHKRTPSTRPEQVAAARRAVADHLTATGRAAKIVPGSEPGWHRVRFAIQDRPKVSIIIPSACRRISVDPKSPYYILPCLDSIREKTAYEHYEILVVENDNDIPPGLALELAQRGVRRVSYAGPTNLAAKMNLGAASATGSQLLFLNDDITVITPDWLESLLEFSQQPDIGAVGARLLFPDGRLQHGGVTVLDGKPIHHFPLFPGDYPGYFCNLAVHRNCGAVTGACLMTRADVFRSLGGFFESFAMCYNDIDYCFRVIDQGKRVVYQPFAQLHHYESVSRQPGVSATEFRLFQERWSQKWARDPYYNVNLSIQHRDFRIASSPEENTLIADTEKRAA